MPVGAHSTIPLHNVQDICAFNIIIIIINQALI